MDVYGTTNVSDKFSVSSGFTTTILDSNEIYPNNMTSKAPLSVSGKIDNRYTSDTTNFMVTSNLVADYLNTINLTTLNTTTPNFVSRGDSRLVEIL